MLQNPPPGQVAIDEQTGEEYDVRYGIYYFQDSTSSNLCYFLKYVYHQLTLERNQSCL